MVKDNYTGRLCCFKGDQSLNNTQSLDLPFLPPLYYELEENFKLRTLIGE